MVFCQKCGKGLDGETNFCPSCGWDATPTKTNSYVEDSTPDTDSQANIIYPAHVLAKRFKAHGIIMIVFGILRMLSIVFLVAGLCDLYMGFRWLETAKRITKFPPKKLASIAEVSSRTSTSILHFIIDFIMLGFVGGMVAFLYHCIGIKHFVRKNQSYFDSLEQE